MHRLGRQPPNSKSRVKLRAWAFFHALMIPTPLFDRRIGSIICSASGVGGQTAENRPDRRTLFEPMSTADSKRLPE
jgi:hypothetical protein